MLKHFASLKHSHLVTLLATFKYGDAYHLMFPYAECDIYEYWQHHQGLLSDASRASLDDLRWLSRQILGVASALDCIHNPRDIPYGTPKYGRHGDIKPDNILWFQSESDPRGTLVIADFGLSSFHRELSRSNIPNRKVAFTPRYRAPESDIYGGRISRSYDIWTLGCFFLEMACWIFGGIEEIEQFDLARMSPSIFGSTTSAFFDILLPREDEKGKDTRPGLRMEAELAPALQHQVENQPRESKHYVFTIKSAVTNVGFLFAPRQILKFRWASNTNNTLQWIARLHNRAGCTEYMHDFLDIVEQQMLLVNSIRRARSGDIVRALQSLHIKAQDKKGVDYILRPSPSPRNHSQQPAVLEAKVDDDVPLLLVKQSRLRLTERVTLTSQSSSRRSIRIREERSVPGVSHATRKTDLNPVDAPKHGDAVIADPSPTAMGLAKRNHQGGGGDISMSKDNLHFLGMDFIKCTVQSDFQTGRADATFVIAWELRQCIEQELDGSCDLGSTLTISGDASHAWAVSCREYVEATWPGDMATSFIKKLELILNKGSSTETICEYNLFLHRVQPRQIRSLK